jgi:hypothetical protein
MKDTHTTAVIFRTFKDTGDVIALFPFIAATCDGWQCESYMHVGQHGAACPHIMRGITRPATPKELCDLACELRGLGYKLRGMSRFPRNAYEVRKQQWKGMK